MIVESKMCYRVDLYLQIFHIRHQIIMGVGLKIVRLYILNVRKLVQQWNLHIIPLWKGFGFDDSHVVGPIFGDIRDELHIVIRHKPSR